MKEIRNAVLIGLNINHEKDFEEAMEEMVSLAEACDIHVIHTITQNLDRANKAHYIGPGKIEEITSYLEEHDVDVILVNHEISPTQLRNLEEAWDHQILDKTMIILEIFMSRAQTKEAKLQVELANLQFMKPRLVGMNVHLGRQGGGRGTKNKGAGEQQLELDRRNIDYTIAQLKKYLKNIQTQRETQRKGRVKSSIPHVALVGYTNAGKSTVMNSLLQLTNPDEEKQVFEKDMLFATLSTNTRSIGLKEDFPFYLSDTVGFISDLPNILVTSFLSTLEEVIEADLLLHVIDASSEEHLNHIDVTNETLKQIGADHIPILYVYNKCDKADIEHPKVNDSFIYISAKEENDMLFLLDEVKHTLFHDYPYMTLYIPFAEGALLHEIVSNTKVLSQETLETSTKLEIQCRKEDANKYLPYQRES